MFRLIALSILAFFALKVFDGVEPAIKSDQPGIKSGLPAQPAALGGELIDPPVKPVSRWGAKFNPSGKVYQDGFRAFYFDRTASGGAPIEEYSPAIAVKYAWSDLHGIDSPTFAGYWVGRIAVERPGPQLVAVSLSWAQARVFIDGKLAYDGSDTSEFVHHFTAGHHLIEVEYINNWHTTEFKVGVQAPLVRRAANEISAMMGQDEYAKADLYYVGLYESARKDTIVDVLLPDTGRSAIVWLDSYEAIEWRLHAHGRAVAVIVAAHTPGSQVTGADKAEVIHSAKRYGVYSTGGKGDGGGCHCFAGQLRCGEEDDLASVAQDLQSLTGHKLAGAAVTYSGSAISFGAGDDRVASAAADHRAPREAVRRQCEALASPDSNRMRG